MSFVDTKLEDDLEEGEIKDDAFEDISECSLSEVLVMQQDLKDDTDVELLREEALKSLSENEEITEEELYRLEALKSLLVNIESAENVSPAKEVEKKKRKRKKKTKLKAPPKQFKTNNEVFEKSKLTLESSDKTISSALIDDSLLSIGCLNKENQIAGDILVTRSWYPKTDSALLNSCTTEISSRVKEKTNNKSENEDFISVPKVLSFVNHGVQPILREPVRVVEQINCCLKPVRINKSVAPVITPVSKTNHPIPLLSVNISRYKRISKHHIRKYDQIATPMNRFSFRNVRNGKYKIVNTPRDALKKSTNPPVLKTEKQNSHSKSVYSINRSINRLPRMNTSEFIIQLDEEDSGKEDDCITTSAERQNSETLSEMSDSTTHLSNQLQDNLVSSPASDNENPCGDIENMSSSTPENEPKVEVIESSPDAYNVTRYDLETKNPLLSPIVTACPAEAITSCDSFLPVEIVENISLNVHTELANSFDESEVLKTISAAEEECDDNPLSTHFDTFTEIDLTEKPIMSDVVFSAVEDHNVESTIEEPEPELSEWAETVNKTENSDYSKVAENNTDDDVFVLDDAEANLIEIRARLLFNLGELEESIKKDSEEKEKLNCMLKKLLKMKSMIFKFEDRIRTRQSKLSIHSNSMQSLFQDVVVRTDTCAQLKDVCIRTGVEIVGPQYKPPDIYEDLIEEKRKTIDFSKYLSSSFK